MSGLRVGLVCPYSFDRPGGVQNHVLGLAGELHRLGHRPAVLAPGMPTADTLQAHRAAGIEFTTAGASLPVPYNGSIARVSFGPWTARRVRDWLRAGDFDLIHLHEPITPSISLLALQAAAVPVVATFHTATPRSRTMQVAGRTLQAWIRKIVSGIAVSEPAREVVVRHLGRDPEIIPNGFDYDSFRAAALANVGKPGESGWRSGADRPRITFLGRFDEPRKGLPVLLAALPEIRAAIGEAEICLAGHGRLPAGPPPIGCRILGGLDEQQKRRLLASTDLFVAPQVARESFGIVVLEALAAGAEVIASDLPAFVALLQTPASERLGGQLFGRGDPARLAAAAIAVLRGEVRSQPAAGLRTVRYDWSAIAPEIAAVYQRARSIGCRGPAAWV